MSNKRLELEISQAELARKAGISVETVANWEHQRSIPAICYLPRIVEFLGYDPFETAS